MNDAQQIYVDNVFVNEWKHKNKESRLKCTAKLIILLGYNKTLLMRNLLLNRMLPIFWDFSADNNLLLLIFNYVWCTLLIQCLNCCFSVKITVYLK